MNRTYSKIIRIQTWKIFIFVLFIGFPLGFLKIFQLQHSGKADDLGSWYRVYCSFAYVAPYALGAAILHKLIRLTVKHDPCSGQDGTSVK